VTLYKCEDCGQIFEDNQNGLADNGLARPMCPRCQEEIDIIEIGEFEGASDATGFY
jgi:DNA-directed RNA polymerase subunit RPC12/RpoP